MYSDSLVWCTDTGFKRWAIVDSFKVAEKLSIAGFTLATSSLQMDTANQRIK